MKTKIQIEFTKLIVRLQCEIAKHGCLDHKTNIRGIIEEYEKNILEIVKPI